VGKRSDFKRNKRDFYPTPYEAVIPLLPHLRPNIRFSEPCCGDGALSGHLVKNGHIIYWASDIEYRGFKQWDIVADALIVTNPLKRSDCIITNPPWDRKILHPMIDHFRKLAPTWLLFDADWMHTKQSAPYMPYCQKIVSVGRVKWIPDSKMTGKDNCAWYLFGDYETQTAFYGRS
jgi:hypothetical protein